MAKIKGAVVINREKCKGCELCVVTCPTETLAMSSEVNAKGYHFSYAAAPETCIGCANCAVVCPDGVITVYKLKVG